MLVRKMTPWRLGWPRMTKIDVVFYEKTYSHCSQCKVMKNTLNQWIVQNPESDVTVITASAEDNLDRLTNAYGTGLSAPIVEVTRNGDLNTVIGLNPDILVDYLSGLDSVWE